MMKQPVNYWITPAVFVMLAFSFSKTTAQDRPNWIRETPKGYVNEYFVGTGADPSSAQEAHQRALEDAMKMIVRSGDIIVSSSESSTTSSTQIDRNDSQTWELVRKATSELSIEGKSKTIHGLVEEERHHEYDGRVHTVWSLVRIPKTKDIESPPNAFSPVWRSTLFPGWGQIYKGQKTKGFLLMGAEALLIPGAIILNNLKINAQSDALASRTQALRDYHTDRANLYQSLSLAAVIVAGTLYVYNVVDAIVAEGDEVYVDRNLSPETPSLCFRPDGAVISIRIRL